MALAVNQLSGFGSGGEAPGVLTLIDRTAGTGFTNMTSAGGDPGGSKAFDGNYVGQGTAACIQLYGSADVYVGKDWGSGVSHIVTQFGWSCSLSGFNDGSGPGEAIQMRLYGSNSAMADLTTGTLLHDVSIAEDPEDDTTFTWTDLDDVSTAYRYHKIRCTLPGNAPATQHTRCAEVWFYETI
tara:strand:+ start:769 stop:1317 length:549 start_codon:yes stop_codon:yes gene_type:complete